MTTEDTHHHADFHDPFAKRNVQGASDIFPDVKYLSGDHVDAPPPYSAAKTLLPIISGEKVSPNDDPSIFYQVAAKLNIHGQGTVVANCVSPQRLLYAFSTNDSSKSSLYIDVTETTISISYGPTQPEGSSDLLPADPVQIEGKDINLSDEASKLVQSYLHSHDFAARYWVSVDHKNGLIRFGRDYTNMALALYEARMKTFEAPGVWHWSNKNFKFVDHLTSVKVQQMGGNLTGNVPPQLVYQPMPVVVRPTPIIVSSDKITLDQMANGSVMVPSNLSPECQRLYGNISGKNIALDTREFPYFSEAIERSVNTEGLICHNLLKSKAAKARELGKENFKTTYLRITMGADLGNSPGAPYVLEIWPAGHSSPIHDHGKTHAVIRVLHGSIKAYYFTSLHDAHQLGPPANFRKGDITWLDSENFQVHMLSNESTNGSVCCTIQCYTYSKKDRRHYENFDYIDEDKKIVKEFEPNSDMRFDEFKRAIEKEWKDRLRKSGRSENEAGE